MQLKQNSAAIMWRSIMAAMLGMTLLLGLVIVLAVGNQVLKTSQATSAAVITSLKKTVIASDADWRDWRRDSTLNTSTSYVKVINMRQDASTKTYYSPATRALLAQPRTKIPLIKHLTYQAGSGFLYFNTGHARGIKYQLWLNISAEAVILWRVLLAVMTVVALVLVISPLYIRLLTKRLTAPLTALSTATQTSLAEVTNQAVQLPVPTRPTEVHQLAIDVNQLLLQLHQQSDQEKAFVMNAAHELKTPIATIRSHAQLIQRHGHDHPEVIEKSVGYINQESQQMQTLVEELLTLARVDQAELPVATVELSTSLAGWVTELQALSPQTITTQIDPDVQVSANAASIQQIVTTLITNANKYIPTTGTIKVVLLTDATTIQLLVSDDGPGISPAEREHIFDRFYRGADVRGTVAGTGLGLAIAQQLAQLNHADLQVAENQPHGSQFKLIFKKLS